ncbi:hypothetical protein AJ88_25380 [Mesorhizobium amorphae CCBAU 01583]|nr:hypothetical protein AJ88_25380 [Mesorhizobium amorphae CCBAU 01583]
MIYWPFTTFWTSFGSFANTPAKPVAVRSKGMTQKCSVAFPSTIMTFNLKSSVPGGGASDKTRKSSRLDRACAIAAVISGSSLATITVLSSP